MSVLGNDACCAACLSVTSEKQKLLDKMERKGKRRGAKGRAGADADLDWLMTHGFDTLVEAEIMRDTEGQVPLPGITRS